MYYTNIEVTWESAGNENAYNDVQYAQAVTILARKQTKQELIRTADGRELLSRSVYYVDPKVEKSVSSIKRLDKLDGEKIESIYIMCGLNNQPKLYRFITV